MQPVDAHGDEFMYFGSICFRGEIGFLNYDDICMCVVIKLFKLLEFVFEVLVPYVDVVVAVTVMRVPFVCTLRECDCAMVTEMLVWGWRCGCGECRA